MTTTYPIPDAALNEHIAFLGAAGAGKTWAAKTAVERLFGNAPICIIDPTGAWWGLRLSRDGKQEGLPFLILGGDHGDVPITEHNGEAVANIVHKYSSHTIVDVSGMLLSEQRRFITSFAEHIFKLNKKPLHLVVDEADGFMPQKPMRGSEMMLNRMDRLVRRGRSRGFRVMLISQRPAVLNKDSLSQVGTLAAMRLRSPQDRAAIAAWIEGQADKKKGKEIIDGLPGMKRGESWVWSPGHDILDHVKFPDITTFDSSSDGGAGTEGVSVDKMSDGDLLEVRRELGIDDMDYAEVDEYPAAPLSARPETISWAQKEQAEKSAERAGYDRGYSIGYDEGFAAATIKAHEAFKAFTADIADSHDKLMTKATELRDIYQAKATNAGALLKRPQPDVERVSGLKVADHFTETGKGFVNGGPAGVGTRKLPKAEHTIMVALAQHGPLDKARLAILTCYSAGGGGFQNAISALRTKGFVEPGEPIRLTAAGKAAAPYHEKLPTGRALFESWMSHPALGKAERAILAVVRSGPLSKDTIAMRTGYAAEGGGFNNGNYIDDSR